MIKKKKDPRKTDADAKKGGAEIAYLRQRLRTKCNEPPNIMTCAFMVASKSNLCEISRADHLQQIMQNNSTIITFETQKQITIVWKKKKVQWILFISCNQEQNIYRKTNSHFPHQFQCGHVLPDIRLKAKWIFARFPFHARIINLRKSAFIATYVTSRVTSHEQKLDSNSSVIERSTTAI